MEEKRSVRERSALEGMDLKKTAKAGKHPLEESIQEDGKSYRSHSGRGREWQTMSQCVDYV